MSETDAVLPPESFLLLDVAGVACALARASVSEVLPLPDLHAPPAGGGPLAGFLNLGGRPVPVLDLARLLGLRAGAPEADGLYRHILLDAPGDTGFLVDRVQDLVTVAAAAIRPVPAERTLNGCVVAEIARGDALVHVLGLGSLLSAEERDRLSALSDAAARRLAALPAA
ncbi:chemotaxis protein CheW [Methylobacterium sp. J-078]|nr:chemotaxis protein CheW [Methylobacterium sp. J-078]